jgi:acyl carrier protein
VTFTSPDLPNAVRRLIHRHLPAYDAVALSDETPIGQGGAGLDSIATTELLLECEDLFGVKFPAELLEQGSLTVGGLVAAIAQTPDASRPASDSGGSAGRARGPRD